MITENGTIKVSTRMDDKVQKEFLKGTFQMGLAFTIIGAIGVAAFLVFDIVSIFLESEDNSLFVYLILFAVFLGLGIGLLVLVNKAMKVARASIKTFTYEFFRDYFIATEISNGETVATVKYYNTQIIKSKETKNYLFFYVNAAMACPVTKCELTEAELNTLRNIFKLPVRGETVELSTDCVEPDNQNLQSEEPKSDDPFDELK